MVAVYLKACKRCRGDMSYEIDVYGPFRQCPQCSYLEDLLSETAVEAPNKSETDLELVLVGDGRQSRAKEAGHVI